MIEITEKEIQPQIIIAKVMTPEAGCVATYIGLIRDNSHGRKVESVTYKDTDGTAKQKLQAIADEVKRKWPVEQVAITHRTGKLKVGDINLTVAVAAGHREEGFDACRFIIDEFKRKLPTTKTETYLE